MEHPMSSAARDPIPAALADSLWLGGEAMVAPVAIAADEAPACAAPDRDVDPSWQVL